MPPESAFTYGPINRIDSFKISNSRATSMIAVFFIQHANQNGDAIAAFKQYLRPAFAFLDDL